MTDYWKIAGLILFAGLVLAGEPVLTCTPQELRGIPGEPLQVELAVETDRAVPIKLQIPAVSNLVLRSIEKIPIRRTENGTYIQKRIVIWQGVEAGSVTLTNLSLVFQTVEPTAPGLAEKLRSLEKKCPDIEIIIDAVEPADPPRPAATPPPEGNKTTSTEPPLLWRGAGTAGRVLRSPEAVV
jgi:hypothetical protein